MQGQAGGGGRGGGGHAQGEGSSAQWHGVDLSDRWSMVVWCGYGGRLVRVVPVAAAAPGASWTSGAAGATAL
ncbi:hypothetical protein Pen02_70770 [Plantactinospora endophytica]|uniref:Uncharacterized protein n=1 Tax=Plantactinospora endophytica TaxID=673535 RepID=A0ABQ4EBN0_9ACTN|nr:hypothetical protein Pen02_70770 [Plantactinospora endophytica]